MADPFPSSEFDDWASGYDHDVSDPKGFPFEGYSRLLQKIVDLIDPRPGTSILDLGIGTGNLALLFAERGCRTWGLDFSAKMLKQAGQKIPSVILAKANLKDILPASFQGKFDGIVSAYAFHHLPLEKKVEVVKRLLNRHLHPGGRLVIGDIAFLNAAGEARTRASLGSYWEQEYYWIVDQTISAFIPLKTVVTFHLITPFSGVFEFRPEKMK